MASLILKDVLAVAIVSTSIGCVGSPAKPSSLAQDSAIVSPAPIAPTPQLGQTVATPPAQTVPASNDGAPGVNRFNVAMSHSGTATVTLTWPNGDFSLQLYVTRGACADASGLVAGACTILGTTRPGTRPGLVTSAVVSGDMITVWVLNPDEDPQTFTVGVEVH